SCASRSLAYLSAVSSSTHIYPLSLHDALPIYHFYSSWSGNAFLDFERREVEAGLKKFEDNTSIVEQLTLDVADRIYRVIQNPIDKALSIILSYLEGEAEKERKFFRKDASLPTISFRFELSLIEVDAGTKDQEL